MKDSSLTRTEGLYEIYDDRYLRVEHDNFIVICNNKSLKLTRTQFLVLSRLVKTPARFVTSEELWKYAWEERKTYNSQSLHVYLYNLRRKLEPFGIIIETLVNVGYRFLPNHHN